MHTQTVGIKQNANRLSDQSIVFIFLMGVFMGAIDHGIVGPALSSILEAFNVSASWGTWSFTIYTLTFAISIPILSKLSDRIGRKQTFMLGISLFAIGSTIAAIAANFPMFLIGRAIQAMGSGGIFPITSAQIVATYPPEKRGRALGYVGVAFGIGTILGPSVGGLIISYFEWQWIFLINLPISFIVLMMVARYKQTQQVIVKPIDYKGIFLVSITILATMYGITSGNLVFIGIGILLIPILLGIEKKQTDPVLNSAYFTRKSTLVILVTSLFSGVVMATSINFLPYFSEAILHLEKGSSGIFATPFAVSSTIASLVAGILSDKVGAKKVLILGFLISLIGSISLATIVSSLELFMVVITIMGFGVGIIIGAPLNILIMNEINPLETGLAMGYLSLTRSIGSTLGPVIGGALIVAFPSGFSYLFILSSVVSILSILIVGMFLENVAKTAK
ncbi:MFS transporter [Fredinandcohnia sp. 179-A 10B2 NHS]|uniref:MFS transporter n=1 Tax=Fredinandcohnia sp. 179-A 10B2 NHS TaxID=3235176 RepID=UPI0039A3D984